MKFSPLLSILAFSAVTAARGAEYISQPTFGSFPTPPTASYMNTGTTTGYGLWQINVDGAAGYIFPGFGGVGSHDRFPTGDIDVCSPTIPVAPGWTNVSTNVLIDLCGSSGPGTLWQTRSNLVAGAPYKLTIVTEAVDAQSGLGLSFRLQSAVGDPLVCWICDTQDGGLTNPRTVNAEQAAPTFTYGGSGHPSTNTVVTYSPTIYYAWRTNVYPFVPTTGNWILKITGVGTHRAALLRSVSITEN